MDVAIARMFDANANRAREAYRVLEDYARFALGNAALATQIKADRHALAQILQGLGLADCFICRDTAGDVGTQIKVDDEFSRRHLADVIAASAKRLGEALRVMEELAKTIRPQAAQALEAMRYRSYITEQQLRSAAGAQDHQHRLGAVRLGVLLTAALCRQPWEQTLQAVLAAGANYIQLREKELSDSALLDRAKAVVGHCRAAGAMVIINDRPDIALLAGADGVHLGQADLPCHQVRKLTDRNFIIGVSTENMAQARQAVLDGASYIGVGPMFATATKHKPQIAGPTFAQAALAEIPLACIAIGGITAENISVLTGVGVRSVAVCSAIIGSANPAAVCQKIRRQLPIEVTTPVGQAGHTDTDQISHSG